MTRITRRETLVGVGLIVLAGCGGGDSSGAPAVVSPPPTPTPTPTPTPAPTPTPGIGSFGTLGVTTSQPFATLGYMQIGKGSGWDFVAQTDTLDTQPGHSIRFDAPSTLLLMVPGVGEGGLVPREGSGSFFNGERSGADFNAMGGILSLSRPIVAGRLQQYLMQAYFVASPYAGSNESNIILQFEYGIAVPPNALPTSGQADYQGSYSEKFAFRADFGAKTISGTIPFYVNGPTQAAQLRDVTISADGVRFTGRIIPPDGSSDGTINGLFMGPTGQEFLAQVVLKSGQTVLLFSGTRET
jgi:hypothetical protein